ncbi:MAG: beta-ketoacyl synthase N-terminal-like domain-containing protein, partial [Thermodesulfobacteriota bacterium]
MTAEVFITQIAAVTPLGEGPDELFAGLMENRSGICKITRFDTEKLAGSFGGIIQSLDGSNDKPLILGLTDMLLDQFGPVDADTRLIVASTKAGIENMAKFTIPDMVAEKIFLSGLTDYISRKLKLKGAGININAACASATIAIAKGAALIRAGAADAVLV